MENRKLEKIWENFWRLKEIEEITENDPAYKIVRDILLRYPKGSQVLDAGSGLGRWVFYFQKSGYRAYGIDIAYNAVRRCQEYAKLNNLNCRFLVGDIRAMPFSDNFFDLIFSFGAIEHFEESLQALKEFYRTLKKDGTCFITTPNVYSVRALITRPISNPLKNPKLGYLGFEKSFTPRQLSKMMAEVGFKELQFGILPDGLFLGSFYKFIPIIGKYLFLLTKKISFWIESHQSKLGHVSYCFGIKT